MKYQRNVHQAAMMITQFGIHMLVPIFACTFLGIWLDKKFGTSWIMVVLFFVGALAGGRNVFLFARKIYAMDGDKRNRDIAHGNEIEPVEKNRKTGRKREVTEEKKE